MKSRKFLLPAAASVAGLLASDVNAKAPELSQITLSEPVAISSIQVKSFDQFGDRFVLERP